MVKRGQYISQQNAVAKYKKEHYDAILIYVDKGQKEIIKAAAAQAELSLNAFVKEAIAEKIDRMANL